jgi:hypothetical protein
LQGDGKPTCSIDVSYVNGFNDFNSHQALINKDIKAGMAKNAYKVKFLREELNSSVIAIKGIFKHYCMTNNQTEARILLWRI